MQIVTNSSYLQSRTNLGNYLNFGSMGLLIVGMVLSFMTDRIGPMAIWYSYVALILALLLLNLSRPFTRRFGPKWRQDQWLIPNLKGLDNQATLFNYASAGLPDHVLVAPSGLYVFVPKPNGGTVRFDGNRWSRGGGITGGLIRSIGEGGLGNPTQDVRRSMSLLASYLRTHGSEDLVQGLEAQPVIVFTNPGVQLEAPRSRDSMAILTAKDLRAFFRRTKPVISPEKVEEIKQVLGREVAR